MPGTLAPRSHSLSFQIFLAKVSLEIFFEKRRAKELQTFDQTATTGEPSSNKAKLILIILLYELVVSDDDEIDDTEDFDMKLKRPTSDVSIENMKRDFAFDFENETKFLTCTVLY